MKNADYLTIIKDITNQINQCESALAQYNSCSHDLSKMVVKEVNTTISSCRKVQGKMDKFVSKDLYHIVGMANLNAAQTSKIMKLTKILLKYRNDIKFFASQTPIPVGERGVSTYELSSGIKLYNGG